MDLTHLCRARALASTGDGRRRRLAAALSLRELADGVGVTASTLARWERGTARPRPGAALRWVTALDALPQPTAAPTALTVPTQRTEQSHG